MVLKKQAQGSVRSVPRGSVEPSPKVGWLNLGKKDGESQRPRPLSWILKSEKWFTRKTREERIFQDLTPPTAILGKSAL